MQKVTFHSKLSHFLGEDSFVKNLAVIIFGSILLALSAQITIPMLPVPFTLQTSAVIFVGISFSPRMSYKIVLAYLLEGICGLPVFANFSGGLHVLFGPTGGYLLGFLPAVVVVGYLLQTGWLRNYCTIFFSALLSTLLIFIPGYFVLSRFVGFHNAYLFGVAPFYFTEICKLFLLTFVAPYFWCKK